MFDPKNHPIKIEKAFHVDRYASDVASKYVDKWGLDLVVHDRDNNALAHEEFAKTLIKYEYYVDVKRDYDKKNILEALSLTGLEALASGCKVINWKGKIIKGLPEEHRAKNVAKTWWDIYFELHFGRNVK